MAMIENIVLYCTHTHTHTHTHTEQNTESQNKALHSDFPPTSDIPSSIPDGVGGVRGPNDTSDDFNSGEPC